MQKPLRKIILIFGFASLSIAIITSFLASRYILPYSLKELRYNPFDRTITRIFYHDFDRDGFKERVVMVNDPLQGFYYLKFYQDYQRGLIDQFNFNHRIVLSKPVFYDYNQDGFDDLFIFSNDNKALYLTIIDIFNVEYLLFEQPILPSSPQRSRENWDIQLITARVVNFNGRGAQLLFSLNSGYSKLPRCLCLYDLQNKKIVRRFDHHMGPVSFKVTDLNQDGHKEIILTSAATNNFPTTVFLSDAFSWLLILDEELKPIKPAQKIGDKFCNVEMEYLEMPGPNRIYLLLSNSKDLPTLITIDSSFQIKKKPLSKTAFNYGINTYGKRPLIYLTHYVPKVQIFNDSLRILTEKELSADHKTLVIHEIENILGDNKPEIICNNSKGLYLFSQDWQLLARYNFKRIQGVSDLTIYREPINSYPVLKFTTSEGHISLQVQTNRWAGKIPFVFSLSFLLSFMILLSGFLIFVKINRYILSFLYFLKGSENAILLIDFKGRILSVNKRINQFFDLKNPLKEGVFIEQGLGAHHAVIKVIQTCKQQQTKVTESISFEKPSMNFIGEISVTPFIGFLGYIYAFLVEIKDSTRQVLLERQQNWQRNVRKMVHDIKTPLAGVQLKLQMLYIQIQEQAPQLSGLSRELETAHNELKRISAITKSFLKFSDLEQISSVDIPLKPFLERALQPFQVYSTNSAVDIITDIEDGVPEIVRWDERQMEILIHILVENAIDAIQEKGKIFVRLRISDKIKNVKEPGIQIRVEDNGPGIPPEIQQKIFEPHFSTKKEGTGLGLAFAKQIVQQHGGQIDFYSHIKNGTVFVIDLPSKVERSLEKTHVSYSGH